MKKTIIYILVCTAFLFSCRNNNRNEALIDEMQTLNFETKKLMTEPFSSLVDDYYITPLETTKESLIGRMSKIIVLRDRIFILDRNSNQAGKIFIFSENGDFQNLIDKKGKGPGEYNLLSNFDIHPLKDIITGLANFRSHIINYDFNGNFINESKFEFVAGELSYSTDQPVNIFFNLRRNSINTELKYTLIQTNEDLEIINKYLPYEEYYRYSMGGGVNTFKQNDHIVFIPAFSDIIYQIRNNKISEKYKLVFDENFLTGEIFINTFPDFPRSSLDINYIYNIKFNENEDFIVVEFMYKNERFSGIVNKKNNKTRVFYKVFDPTCNCGPLLQYLGFYKDYLMIKANPHNIREILKLIDPEKSKKSYSEEIDNKINKLTEASNPIIVFVKLKIN